MNQLIFNTKNEENCDNRTSNGRELSSLALVHHGRSVVINPSKNPYQMDLMNRVMFCIGLAFNQEPVSMQELSACLPKSFTKMLTNVNQLFSQLVLMDEEIKEELMPRFEEGINGKLREIMEGRKQLYLLAGVDSENELQHKLKLISDYKQKAETIYFSQEGTIERKRSIDDAMLTLSPLEHCQHHSEIIKNYWQMISKSPDGYLEHEAVENRIISLFLENLFESIGSVSEFLPKNLESEQSPKNRREMAQLLIDHLQKGQQEILLKLQEELSEAAMHEEEALQLEYLILKGKLIAPTLTKVMVREQLIIFLEGVEREVQQWIPFSKRMQAWDIAYAKEQIEKTQTEINGYMEKIGGEEIPRSFEEIQGLIGCDDHYFEKSSLIIENIYLEDMQKILRKAEERDLYSSACSFASEDPRELEKLIPDLNSYDRLILKVYPFDRNGDTKEDSDLEIDLSDLKDPLAYFVDVYKSKDEEILGFFIGDNKRFTHI